jgi:SH3-like domain-containing protein
VRRLLLALGLVSLGCHAGDFRTVGEGGAVLYDAPSRQATPLFVVTRDYPLEVIVQTDVWLKVRDHAGALSWVEKKRLGERRMVVVRADLAEAHERPEDGAPVTFAAAQDVVLEFIEEAAGGWLRVRHADGADGYLRASLVWGD